MIQPIMNFYLKIVVVTLFFLLPWIAAADVTNAVPQVVAKVEPPRTIPEGATGGEGKVIRLLSDDTEGSRHQRFIIRKADNSTLLIVHNIDLAPRVPVAIGDTVAFCGEFVWNEKGGLIHWTHRDPQNRHFHGWLRHKDRYYD